MSDIALLGGIAVTVPVEMKEPPDDFSFLNSQPKAQKLFLMGGELTPSLMSKLIPTAVPTTSSLVAQLKLPGGLGIHSPLELTLFAASTTWTHLKNPSHHNSTPWRVTGVAAVLPGQSSGCETRSRGSAQRQEREHRCCLLPLLT